MKRCTRRTCLGLAAAATAGLAGCSAGTDSDAATDAAAQQDGETTSAATTTSGANASGGNGTGTEASESPYTEVYRETIGSVVLVSVGGTGVGGQRGGQGSGFVYRDRYVLTNAHVVGDAERVRIQFARGESQTGQVVGRDAYSDLAAIEIPNPPSYAAPLPIAREEPAIGTRVAAIGSPYGFQGTITSGIVSAVDRSVPAPEGNFLIPNAIQTDAPVNPGNSGGPLVDLNGEVLGVINSGGGDNIAFAISAPLVRKVVSALIAEGEYEHPYLGVRLREVTEELARRESLQNARGLFVAEVLSGTPAAATLESGDVLLAVDGQRVDTRQELSSYLELETSPGDTATLTIRRGGERRQVELTLGARPEPQGTTNGSRPNRFV
jgi:S1-C subfamily serine protease